MNHSTNDNQSGSCEGNDIIMSTVDNSNVYENGGNRTCGEINHASMVNSDHVNRLEKETTASNDRVKKENFKTVQITDFDSLHPNDDISSLKFYKSLLRKVLAMNFGDEIDSGRFVLSKETFETIINKLEKKKSKKRFEEVENILYKSINYVLKKKEEEFDRMDFIESIEDYLIRLLKLPMKFSVRKTFFSLIFLITLLSTEKERSATIHQSMENLICYNTYVKYIVPFMKIIIKEVTPKEEKLEIRTMFKILYDRFRSNFAYHILPLDNSIFTIEYAIIHLFDVLREEGVEYALNNTFIIGIVRDLTLYLKKIFLDNDGPFSKYTINVYIKRKLFALGIVMNEVGYCVLRDDTCYLMFIHQVFVWKKIIEFLVGPEDLYDDESLDKGLTFTFGRLKDLKKSYEELFNSYLEKMERECNE
ncbi:Hypothetical protein SRAE_X000011300 [Strongyloides ratti]|uniref:Uncharacterized protein n=1 Tax=Strongyloides ratti TaxID=34506 RepID=A0A090LRJ1_STRRB|nr:Hypothetical protein SRAE_X000011300 [Strongyloides ratti]CEF70782.1 Hypothetical protein SRAE_X000011300 [Strongyloides ratti]